MTFQSLSDHTTESEPGWPLLGQGSDALGEVEIAHHVVRPSLGMGYCGADVAEIATFFATTHGERIAAEVDVDVDNWGVDMDKMKASWGLDASIDQLSYRDLQARRDLIRSRFAGHKG